MSIIVLMVICIAIGWMISKRTANVKPVVQQSVVAHLPISPDKKKVDAMSITLKTIVQDQSPTIAFASLQTFIAQNPKLINRCHDLTHAIGDAAYQKYGNFTEAIKYTNDLCGSGYIHSLIVHALQDTKDPDTIIKTICEGQDGYCYHGIGHGLMFFTENDVPRSLAYCKKLPLGHDARCSEGVYMQNFEDDQDFATPYVYKDDPLRLCREEPYFKPGCYHYTGVYLAEHRTSDENMFSLCDAAESSYYTKCVSGMGARLMATHLNDPKKAEAICETEKDERTKNACLDGLVSYDLVEYNSIPHTETFCTLLNKENQQACLDALEVRKAYYK
ncbi:MAG: hypothetical protein NTX72_06175 [Candidatus Uhrbacteria bacterium]|nr:hypothetical protein [Candidatus Uhrbacteria bacterium]